MMMMTVAQTLDWDDRRLLCEVPRWPQIEWLAQVPLDSYILALQRLWDDHEAKEWSEESIICSHMKMKLKKDKDKVHKTQSHLKYWHQPVPPLKTLLSMLRMISVCENVLPPLLSGFSTAEWKTLCLYPDPFSNFSESTNLSLNSVQLHTQRVGSSLLTTGYSIRRVFPTGRISLVFRFWRCSSRLCSA